MRRASTAGSARAKVRNDRARLRAQGLRPIQIWAPDVHAPGFKAEAQRQSCAIAASTREPEDQAFIEAVSDRDDE
ncbi:antitoxin MazE family protein [Methylobacterium sp. J-088]|uniref:antitoxin MazE family protein n=1 Tax=Methylobacterium sp. J-088 TaxID=2836664 RepID=UPI001FBC0D99|nr:antitoxin MazE family protein [Methylobacterium sp. J-088]MCJ2064963.1 antitoxin MazE family protein [Methylobacterium sp. J-088]